MSTTYGPELSKTDSLREEAEDPVMTLVHAACRSPAGPRTLAEFLNAVAEWLLVRGNRIYLGDIHPERLSGHRSHTTPLAFHDLSRTSTATDIGTLK